MIRLAILEDHPAIAEGLAALLGSEADVTVVGVAADRTTARILIIEQDPDIVLCDVMQGGLDEGLDLLSDFAGQDRPAFVMYSAYSSTTFLARAISRGAAAYVSKLAPAEAILKVLREVARGHRVFGPDVIRAARQALPAPTPRELETIRLLDVGCTNQEVAARMGIRIKTVESQLRRLFDRYGVSNRTSLVHLARGEGWILHDG
jgi:two-component system NarL family response regulator